MKRMFIVLSSLSLLISCGKPPIREDQEASARAQVGSKFTDELLFGTDNGSAVYLKANGSEQRGFYTSSTDYNNANQNYDNFTGSPTSSYSGSGYNPYSSIYGGAPINYSPSVIAAFDPNAVANRYQTSPTMGVFLGFAGWVHTLAPNIVSVIKVNLGQSQQQQQQFSGVCPAGYTYTNSSCVLNAQPPYCANWSLKVLSNKSLKHLRRSLFVGDNGIVQRVDANTFSITWQTQNKATSGFIFAIQDVAPVYQDNCNPYQQYNTCFVQQAPLTLAINGTVSDCSGTSIPVNIPLDNLVNDSSGVAPFFSQAISSNNEIRVRAANFQGTQTNWFNY